METVGNAPFTGDLADLRARVRADRRATSAPVVTFGALVVGYAATGLLAGGLDAGGRHLTLLLFWPVLTVAALLALWLDSRRRATRDGVGEGRPSYRTITAGYLTALLLIVVLFIPVLFVGVFLPLVWPAAVLVAIGVWQRNRVLGALGAAVAVTGGLESLVVFHRGLPPSWAWLPSAVYAVVGIALLAAGLVIRRNERATP